MMTPTMTASFDWNTLSLPGPAGRANAIRATLAQISALPGADVRVGDLVCAFGALSRPRDEDTPSATARRQTCGDLAAAIGALCGDTGDASAAAPWFEAQLAAWVGSADPQQSAMVATAKRELCELLFAA